MIDTTMFTKDGKYLMLALDHRASFKKLINPQNPEGVLDQDVINLKSEIIQSLQDQFSGVLIDETFGLEAYPKHEKPFLLPLEKSGYTEKLGERLTELEYTAQDLINYGASGAKLLLYFNPYVPSAQNQLETALQALGDCQAHNLPLFLEIRVYDPTSGDNVESELTELVLDSLQACLDYGITPEVWKLEYPGIPQACLEITKMVGVAPWILLTKGASFETFVEELKVSKAAGCRGFLAGRALWQEVGSLSGASKEEFLNKTLPERFKLLSDVMLSS